MDSPKDRVEEEIQRHHSGHSLLAQHTPHRWWTNDPSYSSRRRQFILTPILIVFLFLLKFAKEAYHSTWNLYADNMDFMGCLWLYLPGHFALYAHNNSGQIVSNMIMASTITAIVLLFPLVVMIIGVVYETMRCADITTEVFNALRNCFMVLGKTAGGSCAIGADLNTPASGTCPSIQFGSQSTGAFWMFMQYATVIGWLLALLLIIMDNYLTLGVLARINGPFAKEEAIKRKRIMESLGGG